MKNTSVKIICALLALMFVLCATACGNTGSGEGSNTGSASDTTVSADGTVAGDTNSDAQYQPRLPGKLDTTFIIASGYVTDSKYTCTDIAMEDTDGDTIKDAIYRRTVVMSDRHGVNLEVLDVNYKTVNTSVGTGAHEYDLGTATLSEIMNVVNQGSAINLYDCDTIDLDMPWWDQNAQQKLCIGPKLYYTVSDFFITGIDNARCVYFNKQLASETGVTDMYSLVDNNEWTIDKMREIGLNAVAELDGVDGFTIADQVGIANKATTFYEVMLTGCEAEIMQQGKDGVPYFVCFEDKDRFINVYTHLLDNFSKDNVLLLDTTENARQMFMNGKALFTTETMYYCSKMRAEASIEFGIMPVPKYTSDQKAYLHVSPNPDMFYLIPGSAETISRNGQILEALSFYSSSYFADDALMPSYFDLMLASRSAPDLESSKNLQTVHDSISYVIKIIGTDFSGSIYSLFAKADYGIGSAISGKEKSVKLQLSKTLAALGITVDE